MVLVDVAVCCLVLLIVARVMRSSVVGLLFDLVVVAGRRSCLLVPRLELVQVDLSSGDDGTEPLVRRD